jgi:hypothetical protein
MELLLMVAALSLLGLAVTGLAFGAATRREEAPAAPVEAKPETVLAVAPARFFADTGADLRPLHAPLPSLATTKTRMEPGQRVPLEALLLQLESHIRLEQAAAESFLEAPTAALLHGRTVSPLVN